MLSKLRLTMNEELYTLWRMNIVITNLGSNSSVLSFTAEGYEMVRLSTSSPVRKDRHVQISVNGGLGDALAYMRRAVRPIIITMKSRGKDRKVCIISSMKNAGVRKLDRLFKNDRGKEKL